MNHSIQGDILSLSNQTAFVLIGQSARRLVDNSASGVFVTTREQLWDDIALGEGALVGCSPMVRQHFTLGLRREAVATAAFDGDDPEVLLVYDATQHSEQGARFAWENFRAEDDAPDLVEEDELALA